MTDDAGVRLQVHFLPPDEGDLTASRSKAVGILSAVAARRDLELDEQSVLLETGVHHNEVLLRYSAFAYPPGHVPA